MVQLLLSFHFNMTLENCWTRSYSLTLDVYNFQPGKGTVGNTPEIRSHSTLRFHRRPTFSMVSAPVEHFDHASAPINVNSTSESDK